MEQLAVSLKDLSANMAKTLEDARRLRKESKDSFFERDYSVLGKAISHYANCFESLGLKTKSELDEVIGQHFRYSTVQDSVEELAGVEEDWEEFLVENDSIMNQSLDEENENLLKIDDVLETDIELVDARNGK